MLTELIASILRDVAEGRISKDEGLRKCRELKQAAREAGSAPSPVEDIAVIGVAGRYPGASNLEQFWDNLRTGRDSVTEVPKGRWGATPPPYQWGGFLDDVDRFDAAFFSISPREAERMDPQERLFLETAWATLEDGGYTRRALQAEGPATLPGNVGVFVGVTYQEYQLYGAEQQVRGNDLALAGISAGVANRVSYFCNFHGPSLAIDTMCSSSLTAIHLACQSLRTGECELALAGGVNVSIHPNKYRVLAESHFVSSKGRCESFGADGDGYVPGEGVGCVLLKPLSKAERDGDRIYGVIKGTAVNHGGKTNGYTVPNPTAQAAVIKRALAQARVDPRVVSYVEAHGTGTSLGDPIEITGLSHAYRSDAGVAAPAQSCAIGSVKSNIGHCEAAAGIAGLTKVLLQMKHRQLVPSLHATTLNPNIDFASTPFVVQQDLSAWQPLGGTRIAGLSSFGAGGSNAHVILEEWKEPAAAPVSAPRDEPVLVVLSAQNQDRLRQSVIQLRSRLEGDVADLAYTLQVGREAMECRLVFIVQTLQQLAHLIDAWLTKPASTPGVFFGLGARDLPTRALPKDKGDVAAQVAACIAARRFDELAMLWAQGAFVEWERLYVDRARPQRIALPTYPFDRSQRYWFDSYEKKKAPLVPSRHAPLSIPIDLSVVSCRLIDGSIAFVKMEDRQQRNQMAGVMVEELERIFTAIAADDRVKVVVLAGYDDVFCLGGTKEALVGISDRALRYTDVPFVYRGLLDCPVPVIAAMEGHAVGGGLAFGCQADIVYLADESVYGANFMQYGFTPGMGGTLFFKEKFGSNLANEMMLSADSLTGEAMKKKGAPVTITPRRDVLVEAMARARSLAEKPVDALKLLKRTLADRILADLPRIVDEELAMHEETITRPDVRQKIEERIDRLESLSEARPEPVAAAAPTTAPAAAVADDLGAIRQHVRAIVARLLHMDEQHVRPDSTFQDMGVDSIAAVELARDVNTAFGLNLDAVVLYDCPTVDKYAAYIAAQCAKLQASIDSARSALREAPSSPVPPASAVTPGKLVLSSLSRSAPSAPAQTAPRIQLTTPRELSAPGSPLPSPAAEPVAVTPAPEVKAGVAVIGLAGRFPGAANVEAFWRNLAGGVGSVTDVPRERWSIEEVYDPRPMQPNKTYSRCGGFLDGVDRFDPLFFNLSPAEAAQMDPQQRLFLQTAWHAIEDAGYAAGDLAGTSCGVFVGVGQGDYLNVLNAAGEAPAAQSLMGNTCSMLSGRIAYFLDLRGPNMAIDTACSSSLVAIHQACRSIRSGECGVALAGGVYVMTTPMMHVMTSRGAMLSPTGQCRAFDRGADGFVLSEGVGVLVLKDLDQAERDGDHIYAVIRGSAINYDGATNGITAPSALSQEELETSVYDANGIEAESIGLVEAHGTGTKLGDPIEVKALTAAFRKQTDKRQFCALGSVKSNIGHALAAAGVAGAIKTLLCLQHKKLVPTLHFSQLNEHIDLASSPFYVNTAYRDWELTDGRLTRVAALSSFGLSGTNAHVVFEEHLTGQPQWAAAEPGDHQLVTASAKTETALTARLRDLAEWVERRGAEARLEDIAFTLNRGRSHFGYRCAFVVRSVAEMGASLHAVLNGQRPPNVLFGRDGLIDAAERAIYREVLQHVTASLPTVDRASAEARDKLLALAGLYTRGFDLPWTTLYGERRHHRISLPGYPFAEERCWAEPALQPARSSEVPRLHPLVGANTSDLYEQKFTTRFTGREFFLEDHQVGGQKLLPGVAILEMVRAAATIAGGQPVAEIRDVAWSRPVIVGDDGATVTIRLQPDDRALAFEVLTDNDQPAALCSRGTIVFGQHGARPVPSVDLAGIRTRCTRQRSGADCYALFARLGIHYGPSFQTIRTLWSGANEALAELRMPAGSNVPSRDFTLHPSILDGALQAGLGIVLAADEPPPTAAVPYALDELVVHDEVPAEAFAYVTRTDSGAYRVALVDSSGRVCVQLNELVSRPIAAPRGDVLTLAPQWVREAVTPGLPAAVDRTIVFSPATRSLAAALVARHPQSERLELPEDAQGIEAGFLALFGSVKRRIQNSLVRPHEYIVLVSDLDDQCRSAALTALLKTAALENPLLQGKVMHCTGGQLSSAVEEEVDAPVSGVVEVRWARESGLREARRFAPVSLPLDGAPSPFREGGVYWITGGVGGLGLLTARHISATASTRIVLSGRSALTAAQRMRVAELEAAGSDVLYAPCDVSVAADVEAALGVIKDRFGRLDGIVHSAGVIRDAFILKKEPDEVRAVLAPKVNGVLNLERATRHLDLDFILLYSAAAGSLGNLGQCDYAGANAFLDAMAAQSSRRIISMGWPLWAGGGMKVDARTETLMQMGRGVEAMPAATAFRVLDAACAAPYAHLLVLHGDGDKLQRTLIDGARPGTPAADALPAGPVSEAAVVAYLQRQLSVPLKLAPERIEAEKSFEEYGVDSVMVLDVTAHLERELGPLPKTLFFEYPNLRALARHFIVAYSDRLQAALSGHAPRMTRTPAPPAERRSQPMRLESRAGTATRTTAGADVAIIGLSGRYPQAKNLDEFWRNLQNGVDCISEIPASRWDYSRYYDPQRNGDGKVRSKWGGFLDGFDQFDPYFFKISPLEAELMDPQERLLLEVAWETMEDAGYTRDLQTARRAGVYIGLMYSEYQLFGAGEQAMGRPIALSGSPASVANRVSYQLNFRGPSLTVDSMCSSSLTALHLACESLRGGQTEMALVGGVNLSLHPNKYLLLGQGQFVSSKGRCESFGVGGDGYVPGEGVGCVLLKPLAQAEADGDHIYAVIKGTALNHGGKTNGYTVPNPAAQQEVIEAALRDAGVSPREISYVEAHGTGTSLGDPIEIDGLSKAFRAAGAGDARCAIGSVKSNIGHCESAAGMAGLTKILLQMKHRQLVPSLHSEQLNPHIDFARTPFVVQQRLEAWDRPVRVAGLSSFGAGGSNAHVIVEEWQGAGCDAATGDEPVVIVLSAKTNDQLREAAGNLRRYLERADVATSCSLRSVAYTLQVGREAMDCRLAFVASSLGDVVVALDRWLAGQPIPATDHEVLEQAAREWAAGQRVDWGRFYADKLPVRVSLPTYPFARERYWFPRVPEAHDAGERVFDIDLSARASWLAEHRIHGDVVVPGIGYLDLVLQRARELAPSQHLTLSDVVWVQPLVVAQHTTVRLTLTRQEQGFDFAIVSEPGAGNLTHCRGSVIAATAAQDERVDVPRLTASLPVHFADGDQAAFYDRFARVGLDYGPTYRNIRAMWSDGNDCLAAVEGQAPQGDAAAHALYPPLADAALQAIAVMQPAPGARTALPFSLGLLDVRGPLPNAFYVAVAKNPTGGYDVTLIANDGRVIARIGRVELRHTADTLSGLTYAIHWDGEDLTPRQSEAFRPGAGGVLVISGAHDGGLARSVCAYEGETRTLRASLLRQSVDEHDHRTVCLLSEDGRSLVSYLQARPALDKLYFLCGLDDRDTDVLSPALVEDQYVVSTLGWFRCVKALLDEGYDERDLEIVVLTQQSHAVPGTDPVQPGSAGLHGFCQSLAKECTRWTITVVDVDATTLRNRAAHAALLNRVASEPRQRGVGAVAYRSARRYVARVRPLSLSENLATARIREGGTYVIAGGAGGLGLTVSETLVKRYGAQVIWLGRRPLDDAIRAKAESLRRNGVVPHYIQADISSREQLASALRAVQRESLSIHGVIHSAVALNDQSLRRMSEQQFEDTVRTKVVGSINLAETFGRAAEDWMCFFSSAQSLLSAPGQANYAAASSFEDAYARAIGRRLSASVHIINWGYWGEVGAVASVEHRARLERQGIGSISPAEGAEAFLRALSASVDQLVVLKASPALKQQLGWDADNEQVESSPPGPAAGSARPPASSTRADDYVRQLVADTLKIPAARLDASTRFEALGVDSILAVVLTDRLEEVFGRLPRTLVFEYQTPAQLSEYFRVHHAARLREVAGDEVAGDEAVGVALPAVPPPPPAVAPSTAASEHDIAIVGISGRYPGAEDLEVFWDNLCHGIDAITEIPVERWDAERYYDPAPDPDSGKARSKWGGFIEDADKFDPLFFKISPAEAALLDPQERLFMQTVWQTVENAGYTRRRLGAMQDESGKGIGVFVGAMYQLYPLVAPAPVTSTVSYWSIANRVSYFFDFRGPSLAIDTACSSSMVAIHMACESIRRGECVGAVAGGVNLSLHPNKYLSLQGAGLLGSERVSRSLGKGDGFVPGEGVGAVLLKPLALAERDGDIIHGVIKASRVHHSGQGNGYRVPNPNTQAASLTTLFREAAIDPASIDYVEVAANGIDLADAIEIAGLAKAFRDAGASARPCPIGSVKSNIGHLEAASGISQLAKVLLQLRHRELAPTLHADPINPNLQLGETPFYAQRDRSEWPRAGDHPRRALINTTGAGGTTAHLLVEDYEPRPVSRDARQDTAPCLVVLSARTATGVQAVARNLHARLTDLTAPAITLADLAYTLQVGREALEHRAAMVVATLAELTDHLTTLMTAVAGDERVLRSSAPSHTGGTEALVEGASGRAFVEALLAERDLHKLARLWVAGVEIDWTRLYSAATPNRIELPTYPFEKRRCWITPATDTAGARVETVARPAAPIEAHERSGEVLEDLRTIVASLLKVSVGELENDRPLASYGVDSILSTMVMERVRERFGTAVSLAAILEFPTLRALADYVTTAAASDATAPRVEYPAELLPIHPTGSKPPSFWVHGLVGFAHLYKKLSSVLGPDYPIYALQARGVDGMRPPFTEVETMAAHYVDCVRQVQPRGPYYLGGYSSGGLIALEMARQLAAHGESVAQVFLLDTYPLNERTTRAMEEKMDYAMRSVMTANLFLAGSEEASAYVRVEELDGVVPDQHVTRLLKLIELRGASRVPLDTLYRMLKGSIDVSNSTGEALRGYDPGAYDVSPVVFFQATGKFIEAGNGLSLPVTELDAGNREAAWREHITSALDVVNLPCDHFGLLEEPVVATLGHGIAARLTADVAPIHVHPGGVVSEAVIVGGGFAGLLSARVLADHFDRVTILERDALAEGAAARRGIPQGNHLHNLLKGGLNVLCDLFPGFDDDLVEAGSVPFRVGYDQRQEDELGLWPQRDFGIMHFCQSRALLEWCLRRRLLALPNVRIEDRLNAPELLWSREGTRVLGVRVVDRNGHVRERRGDLIVNATGRSQVLLRQLVERGWRAADETRIPVDLGYSTCLFEIPEDASRTWKGLYGYSSGVEEGASRQGGSILPIENNRWIVTLGGRYGSYPPTTLTGFLDFARQLNTPTVYDAIREANPVTGVVEHFRFPASRMRHFERLDTVPERLLHVGDAICCFDPVLGQGMSSAALQIKALGGLLAERNGQPDPLDGLERVFFKKVSRVVETPWQLAAKSHFEGTSDTGQPEYQKFRELAMRAMKDPAVHKVLLEVFHLMKIYEELHAEQAATARRRKVANITM